MKATERFSDRVDNYIKFRPSYPVELLQTLAVECNLTEQSLIADIGSGTGKFSELLLSSNYSVVGVEPNKAMREAAEALFKDNKRFSSVSGDASDTKLNDHSIDLITVAQAFHWFDPTSSKLEFNRVLKPQGHIALVWNNRSTDQAFQIAYEQMLMRHCPEYLTSNHRNISDRAIELFFSPSPVKKYCYPYAQRFDLASFIGRMFSSSYTPGQGTRQYNALHSAAETLFDKFQCSGEIEFAYKTQLYLSDYKF